MKNHKRDHRQVESTASKLLTLISEGQTGYINDWARINDMRNKGQRSSQNQVSTLNHKHDVKKKESSDYVSRKTMNNFGHRKVHSFVPNKKSEQNYKVLSARKISFVREQNSRLNQQYGVDKSGEKTFETKKHNNFVTQSCQTQRKLNMPRYQPSAKLRSENNQMNAESLRKLSFPWLLHENIKSCIFMQNSRENETVQNSHKISQLIRNKIKKKRNQKSFTQRTQIKTFVTEENVEILENYSPMLKIECVKFHLSEISEKGKGKQRKEIKLLKNWLDSKRFRNKRSVSSLLKEHFENRSFDSKQKIGKKVIQINTKPMDATMMKFKVV